MLSDAPMTPELAQALLARVKAETKGIQDRAGLSAIILKLLCDKGFYEEAWQLLETSPGSVRSTEIGILFQNDKIPADILLVKLEGLTVPEERTQALRSLFSARADDLIRMDISSIHVATAQDKIAIASGIMSAMKEADTKRDPGAAEALLQRSLDLVKNEKLDAENLFNIVKNDVVIDPFRKWEILGNLQAGVSAENTDKILAEAVPFMIKADLPKAMELLTTDPVSKYSVPLLSRAVTTMYDSDPEQAANWVQENLAIIDPATAQRITMRVAQIAIKNGEFETAQQWANNLLNPGVKQQVLDQIKAAQEPH